ncbi:hypothetical protein K8R33_03130 [archaeon]|nr:hypothetical protein [archaeon]
MKLDIKTHVSRKPFDEALEELELNGFEPIDLGTNAYLRIQQGKDHQVSTQGNHTMESWVYVPGEEKARFIPNSPILEHAREATQAHRDNNEFYLPQDFVLEKGVLVPYNQKPIPTNRLGEEELPTVAFGDQAQAYGDLLKDAGIEEMPIGILRRDYIDNQEKAFAKQNWFCGFNDSSELDGFGRNLCCDFGIRGVKSNMGETQAQIPRYKTIDKILAVTEIGKAVLRGELESLDPIYLNQLPKELRKSIIDYKTRLKTMDSVTEMREAHSLYTLLGREIKL